REQREVARRVEGGELEDVGALGKRERGVVAAIAAQCERLAADLYRGHRRVVGDRGRDGDRRVLGEEPVLRRDERDDGGRGVEGEVDGFGGDVARLVRGGDHERVQAFRGDAGAGGEGGSVQRGGDAAQVGVGGVERWSQR